MNYTKSVKTVLKCFLGVNYIMRILLENRHITTI